MGMAISMRRRGERMFRFYFFLFPFTFFFRLFFPLPFTGPHVDLMDCIAEAPPR